MNKSKWMSVILVVISVLIVIGVILMWWMLTHQGQRSLYNIQLDVGQTVTVPFEGVALVPGSELEYVIYLDQATSSEYDLCLEFAERYDTGLKEFAHIKVLVDGEPLCDSVLKDVLNAGAYVIPVDFNQDNRVKIKFVFYLPVEVGNEVKNTATKFDLVFTATTK